jgi:hypothetical protein
LGETGSFVAYGDHRLERDLGVANGFSGLLMNETDAMVSQEILDMLEIPIGGKILLKYDLLGFLPSNY